MPKLYLHVGLPKTATSTIQNFLAHNDANLADLGWLYPKTARQYVAHHPLGNYFRPDPLDWLWNLDQTQVKIDLLAEIAATGCDNIIMSTEALATASMIYDIKDYFSDFEVFVVFFLRRQDTWLESAYQEELKNGPDKFNRQFYLETREHWFDYHNRLSTWAQVFGQDHVLVATFDKENSQKAIEHQFLNVIRAPESNTFELVKSQNTSMNRDCLAFFMNMATQRRIAPRFTMYANILRKYSDKHPDPPAWKNTWPPAERRALLEKYGPSNEKVARDFCGKSDGKLFSGSLPALDEPWEKYPGLTAQKAVHIGEFLADNVMITLKNGT